MSAGPPISGKWPTRSGRDRQTVRWGRLGGRTTPTNVSLPDIRYVNGEKSCSTMYLVNDSLPNCQTHKRHASRIQVLTLPGRHCHQRGQAPARARRQPADEQAPAARRPGACVVVCRTRRRVSVFKRPVAFSLDLSQPRSAATVVTDQMRTDTAHAASPGSPPPDDTAIKTSLTIYSCRDGNNILSVGWFSFTLIACGRYST